MIVTALLVSAQINSRDLETTPEIKHAAAGKEEEKKLERSSKPNMSAQVFQLCMSLSAPSVTQNPAASQLLMCPHICPALACSPCTLQDS